MTDINTIILIATIANGESISNAIDMSAFALNRDRFRLFGIIMPSDWTAASLSFLASFDGGESWAPVKSLYDGSEVYGVVSAGGYFPLPDPRLFSAIPMIKIQSGSSAAHVAQEAERTLTLVLRSI